MNRNFLNARYYVLAIWVLFLIEGAYYCRLIPLWEGFDEWGHYAFVEHLRLHPGTLPRTADGVTEEIRRSVQGAPVRHEASDPMMLFEAQQPPLYYWILSAPNRMWIGADISTRVHRLRMVSVLIASLAIPFAWLAALELFHSRRIAVCVCALITAMPALMIDIARVGNESLAIALGSWVILLLLRKKAIPLGIALGLGLLTKAYFLAFLPILILRRRFYSLAVAIGIAGWWYGRTFAQTGTLTNAVMDIAASKLGWAGKFAIAAKMNWLAVLDSAVWTHIWLGGWSFFTVRSWMYRVFEVIFAVTAMMLGLALVRRPWGNFKDKLALLCSIEALFAIGLGYQALSIFLAKHIFFTPGWYSYSLDVAETLLLATGMLILVGRRKMLFAISCLIALFAALNVYSAVFILARHYR
jgi:hypothetical protein